MASRTPAGPVRPRTSSGGRSAASSPGRPTASTSTRARAASGGRAPTKPKPKPRSASASKAAARKRGPGPFAVLVRALGRGLRGLWLGVAHVIGGLVRRLGRGAHDLDPALRRDGVGLLAIGAALLAASAVWWHLDGPVTSVVDSMVVGLMGTLAWLAPAAAGRCRLADPPAPRAQRPRRSQRDRLGGAAGRRLRCRARDRGHPGALRGRSSDAVRRRLARLLRCRPAGRRRHRLPGAAPAGAPGRIRCPRADGHPGAPGAGARRATSSTGCCAVPLAARARTSSTSPGRPRSR